ncbi:MAG: PAS domain-containing sensor histidine kinase, partial [Terrimicrobiaceae bacterium]
QANEGSHVDDEVLWRADGTSFSAEYWSYPQRIDGVAVGAVVTFIDSTERKRAEAALRASEDKYRGRFESSRDAIMTLEPPTWQFTSGNPATLKMFGVENLQAYVSLGLWDLAPERQPNGQPSAEVGKAMIETAMSEGSHFFEWTHRRLSGEIFPATVLLSRMSSEGKVILQATVRDITKHKRAEGAVLQNVARAEELTQLKLRFVSLASHELRTPLANIMLACDLLKNFGDSRPPERSQSVLAGLMTGVTSMVRIVDELLLTGKLAEGKLPFTSAHFPLLDFLRRGCLEVEPGLKVPSRIEITFSDAGMDIMADERLLYHILINLLENALKYSPDNTKVEVGVDAGPDSITLSVRDHGIGVPEAERKFLFDAFSRASNVGDKPGSGLGLFLAQKCAQAHGGQMRYTPLPDGSAFSVNIPLAAVATGLNSAT